MGIEGILLVLVILIGLIAAIYFNGDNETKSEAHEQL
jgi:hypothetical protein